MPKIRTVVIWTVAALVTLAMEVVGLDRAIQLRDQLASAPSCAVPVVPAAPPPAPAAAAREIPSPPSAAPPVRLLTVRDDAVVIEAAGRRHELPGYPSPRKDHRQGYMTAAVIAPDDDLVAIAGECPGESGVTTPVTPSCARVFVRVYRVGDGAHIRDLQTRWQSDNDRRRPLAMAFDASADRLAVLVRESWSDCMWAGDRLDLSVYRLSDGRRVAHRSLEEEDDTSDIHSLTFRDDEVQVRTAGGQTRMTVRVVQRRRPDPS
jgi:hypothetical protein